MKNVFFPIVLLIIALTTFGMFQKPEKTSKNISAKEAYDLIQKDSTIVWFDVRRLDEYRGKTGHLKGALLIPIQELEQRVKELEPYKKKTIIAYCRTGRRSGIATELLSKKGFTVFNLEGGIVKWNEEKLPVVNESQQ